MLDPPSGQVTFLFTDVEGSTVLWDRTPDAMKAAVAEHDRRLRAAIDAHGGYVFTTAGDSFAVAFASPRDALDAALAAQLSLLEPVGEITLKVRMALHTGAATLRDGDYFGVVVNRCARLMSAGHGGQLLLSQATTELLAAQLPDSVEVVDLGEHRLKDLAQPERIFQVRHPQLDGRVRRLRALEGPARNLPLQLTSFVGREREEAEVRALLVANRLVTLTGSGGAGKTRLAIYVAGELLESFPDGIRLVELAAVTDPDVLVDEVAQTFNVQASPGIELVDKIIAAIGERRTLLILDNCEHLLHPVRSLAMGLLEACPNLKVLTTSRELLSIGGESVYHVPSLALPPSGIDASAAMAYDAVQLFVERARLIDPGFAIDRSNVADVVDLCRRLDGVPLALELAAARLRMMSPAQIVERLDQRFRLLVGAQRSGSQRHQTLQATIDWSHNLLSEPERMLFRRLSWFTGDFSLEAAGFVGGFDSLDQLEAVDLLSALVDKSMVAPERGSDGTTRYQLLETMRQYGRLRLDESADAGRVPQRHAEYYADYSEVLQLKQRQGQIGIALALRDQDEDNLRAALRWSLDQRCEVLAARIIGAVGYLWYAGGLYREGSEWCRELFDLQPDLPDDLQASVLHAYGTLLGSWAQPAVGVDLLAQEVELRRRLGDPARLASALNNLGNLLHDLGRFDEGDVAIGEAIEQFRAAGESPTLSLVSLGSGFVHRGEYGRAAELLTEALREGQAAGNEYGIAVATQSLGDCRARQGRYAEARRLTEEGRRRFEDLNVSPGVAYADFLLAVIDRGEGLFEQSAWRMLAALSVPDGHWYLATQYWIVQLAASIVTDAAFAAELLGAAAAHYDESTEAQPVFVFEDLEATRAAVAGRLGPAEFEARVAAGRLLRPKDAVGGAIRALHEFIDQTWRETGGTDVTDAAG